MVSVENANGDVVSYSYDEFGNKIGMTYPSGQTVSYEYDSMNRMTAVVGLDGEKTTYQYDAAGRRTQTQTGSGEAASTLTTTYAYDSVGNLLEQVTSGVTDISFAYTYNKNNYIVGETRTEANGSGDGNGNSETTTTTSSYTYDPLGQLTEFLNSTGYGESYTYDAVGNMKQKAITPATAMVAGGDSYSEEAAEAVAATPTVATTPITLTMAYNKGNQLTAMAQGKDKLTYSYDKNRNMVQKALNSKEYGKLTDTYSYNAQDMITGYVGYDGYEQTFTYDANGMRLTKSEKGNGNRSTLEELLRGEIAGLPEVVVLGASAETYGLNESGETADPAAVAEGYEWATTEYLYDITQQYYQVIQESVSSQSGKNGNSVTAYDYGLERLAAHSQGVNGEGVAQGSKTSYVYDGRGSVAQTITVPVPGESKNSILPDVAAAIQITSFAYTAFGEQMNIGQTGSSASAFQKVSGFGYNAEYYDAATGMQNLRARRYEPALARFSQKDLVRGEIDAPLTLNRYLYVANNPINYCDPSGLFLRSLVSSAVNTVKKAVNTVVSTVKKVAKKVISSVSSAAQKARSNSNGAAADAMLKTLEDSILNGTASENSKKAYFEALTQITALGDKATPERIRQLVISACDKHLKATPGGGKVSDDGERFDVFPAKNIFPGLPGLPVLSVPDDKENDKLPTQIEKHLYDGDYFERYIGEGKYFTREEWGASGPRDYEMYLVPDYIGKYYETIVIHHSDGPQNASAADIQKSHIRRGLSDIAYHYVIDKDGKVYEGRPIEIVGAHVLLNNSNKIGIVLLGNFHPEANGFGNWLQGALPTTPTQEQMNSLAGLTNALGAAYGIDAIGGHRDYADPEGDEANTVCPGDTLYDLLQQNGLIK